MTVTSVISVGCDLFKKNAQSAPLSPFNSMEGVRDGSPPPSSPPTFPSVPFFPPRHSLYISSYLTPPLTYNELTLNIDHITLHEGSLAPYNPFQDPPHPLAYTHPCLKS